MWLKVLGWVLGLGGAGVLLAWYRLHLARERAHKVQSSRYVQRARELQREIEELRSNTTARKMSDEAALEAFNRRGRPADGPAKDGGKR